MRRSRKIIAGGALAVAVVAGGAGVAVAGGVFDDDDEEEEEEEEEEDVPITGEALDRASAVALEEHPGGRVTDTEVGDEEGAYEVEVTLEDGDHVDVHLDEDFNVLSSDDDGPDDSEDDGGEA